MRKGILFLALIALTSRCREVESYECTITQMFSYSNNDVLDGRYDLVHDGHHYTEVRWFTFDNEKGKYVDHAGYSGTFQYDGDKLTEADFQNHDLDFTEKYEFSYVDGVVTVVTIHHTVVNGGTTSEDERSEHYVEFPKDSIYYIDQGDENPPVLYKFKDGNLVGFGFENPDGDYLAYDTTWRFSYAYYYDEYPNALKDYAIRYFVYNGPSFGHNRNNMIREVGGFGAPLYEKTQTFSYSKNLELKAWIYNDTGRKYTFESRCR